MTLIANYLGLPVVIDLLVVNQAEGFQSHNFGERFESTAIVSRDHRGQPAQSITAQVLIPNNLPVYGSSGLRGFHLCVKVSDNCQKYPKTFAAVMAHEFSHIVLYSIKHNHKDSEIYTDLTAMILGFSDIVREGRKTVEIKETPSKTSTTTTTTTTTYGYLSDNLFNYAFEKIRTALIELKKTDRELQDKILSKVASYKILVSSYEEKRKVFCKLLENFDRKPKKIGKEYAAELVRMHRLYFLEELADKGKRNFHVFDEHTESSKKILVQTSLYSKQRLNSLQALLKKVENSISEIESDLTSIQRDISILAKKSNFLLRYRVKHYTR